MKNQIAAVMLVCLFLLGTAVAAKDAPKIPRTLVNARYVYVRAYDGDEFNPELLPEDRSAINTVQEAIQHWGKLALVYRPEDADVILVVESRPSEDVLAVYDAHMPQTYLWRAMGRSGLQKNETPLFSEFENAWKKMTN